MVLNKVFAGLGVILTIILTFSVFDYHTGDPSFFHATGTQIKNIGGYTAYIVDPIIQAFGYGILWPIIFIFIHSIKILLDKQVELILIRYSVMILNIPLSCLILAFNDNNIGDGDYYTFHLGGYLGYFLKTEFFYHIKHSWLLLFVIIDIILICIALLDFRYFKIKLKPNLTKDKNNLETLLNTQTILDSTKNILESSLNNIKKFDIGNISVPPIVKTKPKFRSKFFIQQQPFIMPSADMLTVKQDTPDIDDSNQLTDNKTLLSNVLNDFGIKGTIISVINGPVITLYEFEPVAGTKSSRIIALADDIARSMSVISARIATVTGKNTIGIEIPNQKRKNIYFKDLIVSTDQYQLPLFLGQNITGKTIVADLAKMPHLLIAGTTGSGKSLFIHSIILSLLYKYTPESCKFILIDPKMLELSVYDGIPHLLTPVVTTHQKAIICLKWLVKEMESRYRAMSTLGVRNITAFNTLIKDAKGAKLEITKEVQTGFDTKTGKPMFESIHIKPEVLPYIVVIIDEMADLMLNAGKDVETSIQRLAQMARAAGIHVITATQRPSVDVITGLIKANFPTRISLQVTSKIDSRTILDEIGAEQLLGKGDMLYKVPGNTPERIHAAYIDDQDITSVVNFLKSQGNAQYNEDIINNNDSN
jgi:S-DNA-T family DNA segregation ATPase FtsK/SpoIIIE